MLASSAAVLMAVLAVQLARVDASLGDPVGADRLMDAVGEAGGTGGLPAHAEASARQALASRPIDGRAYRVLGQLAMADGDDARAGELLRIAARRWPRDRLAQALLAQRAFEAGDTDAAVTHLDALLRVAPDMRAPLFAEMGGLLAFPEFRSSLIERMALDPPWRAGLIRALTTGDAPAPTALALLDEMAASHALKDDERQARVVLLARGGSPQDARQAWLQTVDPAVARDGSLVFDGGFEHPGITGGFGWQLRPAPGFTMAAEAGSPGAGNRSLAITFNGRAVQFAHLRQALALPAGRYRLRASSDNRTGSARAFVWQLHCEGSNERLVELALPNSSGWQQVNVDLDVPGNCGSQTISLRHTGRNMAERQMRGTLYLDDVEVAAVGN